jgi:hypothetical protein
MLELAFSKIAVIWQTGDPKVNLRTLTKLNLKDNPDDRVKLVKELARDVKVDESGSSAGSNRIPQLFE